MKEYVQIRLSRNEYKKLMELLICAIEEVRNMDELEQLNNGLIDKLIKAPIVQEYDDLRELARKQAEEKNIDTGGK